MIKFPSGITDDAFNTMFSRGMVIRTKVTFSNGSEDYKRLIVVNLDCSIAEAYHFICTSKTAFYEGNHFVKDDCLFIELGQSPVFDRRAAVDIRQAYELHRSELMNRYKNDNLDFLGILEPGLMQLLDEKIRGSKQLAQRVKNLIVTP